MSVPRTESRDKRILGLLVGQHSSVPAPRYHNAFLFQGPNMTDVLLSLLLAAAALLVAGGPLSARDHNGTVPLVLWHGMGELVGLFLSKPPPRRLH